NVAIAAKSSVPNPRLPGTIHSAAEAVTAAGGQGLALKCDIREEDQVHAAVAATVDAFGGIDILVNNASAIWLRGTLDTPMKRFDLMQQVNARGSFLCAQACLPYLLQAPNPHILTLAPPPSLDPKWWGPHTGYTLAKMGMSFVTLGLAAEFGRARKAPLGVTEQPGAAAANRFPAYIDLVRRQLANDYPESALQGAGLTVLTGMSPSAQAYAEGAVARATEALQTGKRPPLEAGMVVTDVHAGDVLAVVGSRDAAIHGFNRAVEAKRPVG
ncbi:SDR family oxidoreductase, partial [Caulobacter sp.]|uniref:SDR family oxidoreductase n=1 Tax=Caulobacter sp. TaxID=78 RepID=UPI001B0E7799